MSRARRLIMFVAIAALVAPSHAIIRRHDRDDAAYLERAKGLPAVVRVIDAAGTLVGPRWVLTAAHVAQDISPAGRSIEIGGRRYLIDKIVAHPTWKGRVRSDVVDMALLRLTTPVGNVEPAPLYEWDDEVGRGVLLAGRGMTGTGRTGPDGEDGRLRAATNTVDSERAGHWLRFQFDAPPAGTDLEGISGPGDSGGPAFIERDARWCIAGVSSSNDDHGLGPCRYGTTEYYARVSSSVTWLRRTMQSELATPPDEWPAVVAIGQPVPDTPAGRIARAFLESYASGTSEAMQRFERTHRAASALAEMSVEDRVAQWPELRATLGSVRPRYFVEYGPLDLELIVVRDDATAWHSLRFQCEEAPPQQLVGILIAPAAPPVDG